MQQTNPMGWPGPRGLPLVGSLVDLARDPLAFFSSMPRIYGDVASWRIARQRFLALSHPAAIEEVLLDKNKVFVKDVITQGLSDVLGAGLLTSEGDHWKAQRRRVGPAFGRDQLASYADAIVELSETWVAAIGPRGARSLFPEMSRLTLEIVVRTLFGTTATPRLDEVGALVYAMMEGFETHLRSWQRLLPHSIPSPARRRMMAVSARLEEVLTGIIRTRRDAPPGNDVLSRLLQARDESGAHMTDTELRDEAITIFVAGHETTALVLTYTLYLLGHHDAERKALHAELDAFPDRLQYDDMKKLVYTRAILEEAMRLYPPAYIIGRQPIEDTVVQGIAIPKGTQIMMIQWVVHRDPRWYADPDTFRPTRWLDGSLDQNPKFAYFPFGGGARTCVGNHFAMMEATLALGTIARTLDWTATEIPNLPLDPAVTLRPAVPIEAQLQGRR